MQVDFRLWCTLLCCRFLVRVHGKFFEWINGMWIRSAFDLCAFFPSSGECHRNAQERHDVVEKSNSTFRRTPRRAPIAMPRLPRFIRHLRTRNGAKERLRRARRLEELGTRENVTCRSELSGSSDEAAAAAPDVALRMASISVTRFLWRRLRRRQFKSGQLFSHVSAAHRLPFRRRQLRCETRPNMSQRDARDGCPPSLPAGEICESEIISSLQIRTRLRGVPHTHTVGRNADCHQITQFPDPRREYSATASRF
jgi:hypothetical protein